ncbi:YdcH family protein [Vibrio algarum]|uniref:YdcH family protein n=1 Tax=Vibrio algarum TaxID=3020714 RepID=A0ABT4YTP3_9VIBR|nr:YdcH family protein [Vibrio sp. KJ40-1]MDB1124939.1 YdcH family protein [Vibrio sp. KJ40-1]
MLGENHAFSIEFPALKELLVELSARDPDFDTQNKSYCRLDEEIRNLELGGAPINDETMHQLKHDRAVLKDKLYTRLINEKNE